LNAVYTLETLEVDFRKFVMWGADPEKEVPRGDLLLEIR